MLSFDINQDVYDEFKAIEDQHKCSKKKIFIPLIAITITIALIATVLLVGYIKLGWFKANEEQYEFDIKIKSLPNQAQYFTEKKTVKSKVVYTSDDMEEKDQVIETNFLVIQTDREEVITDSQKLKFDYLNNAILVILDSKASIEDVETKLNSFNIFDEKVLSEFEFNPNGKKYPIAKFAFFDNGTVLEINLPETMDKYDAQAIIELIDNVIPKLKRNAELDRKNGINVEKVKTANGEKLTETHATREYSDKFTGKYTGSKYSKRVERNFENEKLTQVNTNQKLVLETQKEENELDFGLKSFTYDISSEILSKENKQQKKETEFVKKLAKKLNFIKSDELLEKLLSQEQEQLKKENEENGEEIDLNDEAIEQLFNAKQLRRLAWDGSFSYSWEISKTDVLGKKVSLTYAISLSGGKVKNTLTAKCGDFSLIFGNKGTSSNKDQPQQTEKEKTVFSIPFPGIPVLITFNFKLGGSIGYKVNYDTGKKQFSLSLTGSVFAKAEAMAGVENLINVKGGVKGTFISVTLKNTLSKSGSSYTCSKTLSATVGELVCYVTGQVLGQDVFKYEKTVYPGKSI